MDNAASWRPDLRDNTAKKLEIALEALEFYSQASIDDLQFDEGYNAELALEAINELK